MTTPPAAMPAGAHSAASRPNDTVVLYTVQPAFFLWALLLVGFVGGAVLRYRPGGETAVVFGWVYIFTFIYTLVTLLFDVNTPRFLLWIGVFLLLWLACKYVEALRHIPVLSVIVGYFAGLRPALGAGFAMVVSWLLLPAWASSIIQAIIRGKKTITPNNIEEHVLGSGHEVSDRTGLHFRTKYRDIFETLLGLGAADLEALDASGKVVKRWPNVLFLAFNWKSLDAVLHQRASLVDNPRTEPVEVEDARQG